MAILNGLIRRMSGSAGDFTFSQVQGRTIVSEKITNTTDRKTAAQQRVRMKWGNIIQMYKGIMPLLQCGFENKAAGKTKVSTQTLIDHNALLATYADEDAYQGAVNSYGGEKSAFLTPDYEVGYGSGSGSGTGGGDENPEQGLGF